MQVNIQRCKAIDIGVNVLFADSDGGLHGEKLAELLDKIRRCKKGSKGRRRAMAERDDYIRWVIKRLPWDKIKVLVLEDLKRIKHGKKKGKGKWLRKLLGPWNQGKIHELLATCCEDLGIAEAKVEGRGNSITCPKCGSRHRRQRKGSIFRCWNRDCRFTCHADTVGAMNALRKGIRDGGVEEALKEQSVGAKRIPYLTAKAAKAALKSKKIQEHGRERAVKAKLKKSKLTRPQPTTSLEGRQVRQAQLRASTKPVPAPCAGTETRLTNKAPCSVVSEIERSSITEEGCLILVAESPVTVPSRNKEIRSDYFGNGHESGVRDVCGES